MILRRFLLGFAALSLSLFVVAAGAEGKSLSSSVKRSDVKVRNLFATAGKTRINNSASSKRRAKSARSICCACAPTDEWEAGGCFSSCLRSWGVNTTTGAACAAACIAAGTGNPVAIGICAGCLGTGEWIVAGCAMKCAWGGSFLPVEGPVSKGRQRSRSLRATV